MGLDPVSWALIGTAAAGAYSAYSASQNKPPEARPSSPPAIVSTQGPDMAKKRKQYKPAAQIITDQDLRLGVSGRLGK